jgi:hypothetical protein
MAGTLILPQVQVKWGSRNLSAYTLPNSDGPQAIVFNTKVDLPGTSWPTATFQWNPTGAAYKVYEECVTKGKEDEILIRFYYVNGPFIIFKFQYNGSTINYGRDMSVEVTLITKQGPKSSGVRATAMKDYTDGKFNAKGQDLYKSAQDLAGAFGKPVPLVYQKWAKLDAQKIFLASWQYKDQTYGAQIMDIATQAGQKVFPSNVNSDGKAVVFNPFSKEGTDKVDSVQFPPKAGQQIKSEQRYGYLIGPGILTSFQRSFEYPSQTQGQDNPTQPTGTPNQKGQLNVPGSAVVAAEKQQTQAVKDAQKKSVVNPSSPSVVKGNRYTKNDEGPKNQELMQQEEGVKFQAGFFMCPALVGIKPQDIIYIPSLKVGDALIEDYKVQSVSYSQDGPNVTVDVQATRTPGLDKPMNETAAKKFIQKADSLKTVDDWTRYAWAERLGG